MSPTTGTEPASESEPGGDAAYTPFGAERRLAVTAAREAGELLRARFRRGVEVWEKGEHGDVVTDLDLAAERLIVRRIRQRFPRDRIRAEEAGVINGDGSGRSWLVDPLDGSNNVAIGLPAYVVGVALCVDDAPVIGVVYDPVTEQTWSAEAGAGAFGPRGRLTVAERPLPRSGPLLAWTQGHGVARDDGPTRALRTFLEARSRRMLQLWAPLLSWVMLARGDIDGFVGFRAEAIDLPAGTLLAAEAGLEVRTLAGDPFLGSLDGPDTARSF
ncbi:inositol monophosphatase, partial [Streptomyces klenkii]